MGAGKGTEEEVEVVVSVATITGTLDTTISTRREEQQRQGVIITDPVTRIQVREGRGEGREGIVV